MRPRCSVGKKTNVCGIWYPRPFSRVFSHLRPTFSLGLLTPQPSKSIKQILRVCGPWLPDPAPETQAGYYPLSISISREHSAGMARSSGAGAAKDRRRDVAAARRGAPGARRPVGGRAGRLRAQPIPEQPPPRPPRAERGGGARRWRRRQRRRRRLPWGGMERGGGSGAERRQPRRCRAAGAAARLPVLPPASAPSR